MNEETRKYIENLRKKFKSECNGPGDLKRRQELLANTRRATTICNKEFTKTETEYAAFEVGRVPSGPTTTPHGRVRPSTTSPSAATPATIKASG